MNIKMVFYILGYILKIEAGLLALPLIVAIYYREAIIHSFIISILLLLSIGFLLTFNKPENRIIYAKEGLVIVALSWVVLSVFGAFPYYLSGEIPVFIDAVFESVSGFTTTGSSVVIDIESMSNSLLFWRSFTQWIGGMGVLVFVLMIGPLAGGRSMYIMKAEVPGPTVDKLVPKIQQSAMILYTIYIIMTIILTAFLVVGGMPIFDSILHSFGTAGTGGFGIKAESVYYYKSAYIDGIITVFMVLFGINFNLYYLMFIGNIKIALKSEELRNYIGIIIISTFLVTLNLLPKYGNILESIRFSAFQVSSVMTTTGYTTADFNQWPMLSKMILFLLMFIGGSAGSTAGGIKVSRVTIVVKSIKEYMKILIQPRYVGTVRFEDKPVKKATIKGVLIYISLYFFIFLISILLISIDNIDFETIISAVTTCLNTVAPGFGLVGPLGNFEGFSAFSKIVLSFNMLIGRLEIFPVLMLFLPGLWKR